MDRRGADPREGRQPSRREDALADLRAVRRLREERSLRQEELASRAGTTFGTVSRIESAKSAPAWWTMRKIAESLGVSLREMGAAVEAER